MTTRSRVFAFFSLSASLFFFLTHASAIHSTPLESMRLANDHWQRVVQSTQRCRWHDSAYHIGNMAAYRATGNEDYLLYSETYADAVCEWEIRSLTDPDELSTHPDNQAAGAIFIDLFTDANAGVEVDLTQLFESVHRRMDAPLDDPNLPPLDEGEDGIHEWKFIDWIYMAGPVFSKLGELCAPESEAKPTGDLLCSDQFHVLNGAGDPCDGGSFNDGLWLYLWPEDNVDYVDFFIDGSFHKRENLPPFELSAGASTEFTPGEHAVRAEITLDDGTSEATTATFTIGERAYCRSTTSNENPYWDKMFELYQHVEEGQNLFFEPTFDNCDNDESNPLLPDSGGLWWHDVNRIGECELVWGRGIGWVMAAIPRTLEHLPSDYKASFDPGESIHAQLVATLKSMAQALLPLQRDDGFWNPALLNPLGYRTTCREEDGDDCDCGVGDEEDCGKGKETSGTAFITYGIAWGINNGYLARDTYLPVVMKAWAAMESEALQPTGELGYVQGVGQEPPPTPNDPDAITVNDSADSDPNRLYGIGAFLLAGSEVGKLGGLCSDEGRIVGGAGQPCDGGTFGTNLWLYLWPDDDISHVDFYIDGASHKTELYPPFELSAGQPTEFAPGEHSVRSRITLDDGTVLETTTRFTIGAFDLLCSDELHVLDGDGEPCDGGMFNSPLWAYLWPEDNVDYVDFFIDGSFHKRENLPPFELSAGASTEFTPGEHAVRAEITLDDGTSEATTATFTIGERAYDLLCSDQFHVLNGAGDPCDGGSFNDGLWLYLWPETDVANVEFYVDGEFRRTESFAPYELNAGAKTDFTPGDHTVDAIINLADGSIREVTATFTTN